MEEHHEQDLDALGDTETPLRAAPRCENLLALLAYAEAFGADLVTAYWGSLKNEARVKEGRYADP